MQQNPQTDNGIKSMINAYAVKNTVLSLPLQAHKMCYSAFNTVLKFQTTWKNKAWITDLIILFKFDLNVFAGAGLCVPVRLLQLCNLISLYVNKHGGSLIPFVYIQPVRASDSAEHSSNQSRRYTTQYLAFAGQMQHIRPESRHLRIVFGQCKPKTTNLTSSTQTTRMHANAPSISSFARSLFGLEMSNPATNVFFTCSSNLLMMAWTHSTGLCAAMLRRMRAPLCLLSITFAIPIPAPELPRAQQIPPKPLRKIIKEENRGGGGGRRGVWFSFSLQAYSTTPP